MLNTNQYIDNENSLILVHNLNSHVRVQNTLYKKHYCHEKPIALTFLSKIPQSPVILAQHRFFLTSHLKAKSQNILEHLNFLSTPFQFCMSTCSTWFHCTPKKLLNLLFSGPTPYFLSGKQKRKKLQSTPSEYCVYGE